MVGGSFWVLWLLPPTKTGRHMHDIAEILLKVALSTKNQNQIKIHVNYMYKLYSCCFYNGNKK